MLHKILNKSVFIIFLIIIMQSCNDEPQTVEIGMQTNLITNESAVLKPSGKTQSIFNNYLKLKDYKHFPGKVFTIFDTVYTSTLELFPVQSKSMFLPEGAGLIDSKSGKNVTESLLFKVRNRFIYRMAIPEEEFKHFIIIDIPGTDSAKITSYYFEDKLENIVTQ